MKNLQSCIERYLNQGYVKNVAIRVGDRNVKFCDLYYYNKSPIDNTTMFDMASVTKVMVTTPLAMIAIDKKLINLNDSVSKYFDVSHSKQNITIENLLTHTMGIGHKALNIGDNNYDNVHNYILSLASDVEIGTEVLYSCPGFILLGKIIEKVFGDTLDNLFMQYISKPLGLKNTCFLPDKYYNFVNSNISENEKGLVNDYNCRFLGGIAGNAGLFSNMNDICRYITMLHNYGEPIISKETFNVAIKNYTSDMSESRCLGFVYVDKKYSQTGKLFSEGSIGHCGHTGQSVFVDLKSGLYTVILSNATISGVKEYGYENYDIVMKMREDIHNAIYEDLREGR